MAFKYLEDIATADIAVEVSANSKEQLFQDAANAVFDSMTEVRKIQPLECKEIRLENRELDKLLFDWLAEIIFIKDRDEMLFNRAEVVITGNKPFVLKGKVWGEKIDLEKHELRNDIKAVTFHRFKIEEVNGQWKANIIFDI